MLDLVTQEGNCGSNADGGHLSVTRSFDTREKYVGKSFCEGKWPPSLKDKSTFVPQSKSLEGQ